MTMQLLKQALVVLAGAAVTVFVIVQFLARCPIEP
jgi:hypothetical protein